MIIQTRTFFFHNMIQNFLDLHNFGLFKTLCIFRGSLVQLFDRHIPQFHMYVVYPYKCLAPPFFRHQTAEYNRQIQKLKMRQVLQKLPVHFSIDKPVYNAVFDFLILKKVCHIHCRTLSSAGSGNIFHCL